MSKKLEDQLMKFQITNNKLKMEISIKDLVWLFENSPNNFGFDGDDTAKVKRGMRKEFVEYVVNGLMDESSVDDNTTKWGSPFEEIFMQIFEGFEDEFIKYPNEGEED